MKNFYASMFISLMCALSAQAAVIQVTSDKSGTELQAAINAASSGDTLTVQAGTYYGNFTMKQGVNVIGGWDANFETQTDYATILDAQENGRVVNQEAAFDVLTVWENLTIQNGKDESGTGKPGMFCHAETFIGRNRDPAVFLHFQPQAVTVVTADPDTVDQSLIIGVHSNNVFPGMQ